LTRLREPGELPHIKADAVFIGENGGYVAVSVIENKEGNEAWIHEVYGSGMEAAILMARARRQASEWGFDEVWANVSNPKLAHALRDHGWTLEQVILKGRTKRGN